MPTYWQIYQKWAKDNNPEYIDSPWEFMAWMQANYPEAVRHAGEVHTRNFKKDDLGHGY